MSKLHASRRGASGFSLIEVLIALIVIAIGLLGIAQMQAMALSTTGNAARRALAAIEADSLAAAMHVNRYYWATGVAPTPFTVNNGVISDPGLATVVLCTSGNAAPCSAAQIAAYDVQQWAAEIESILPNPVNATVTCPNTLVTSAPITCTITITWSENQVSINAQSQNGPAMLAPTYTLYVQP